MIIGLAIAGAEIGSSIALRSAPYLYAGYRFMTSSGLTDGAAKVASDISWLIKQPYHYFSSINLRAITGFSECMEKANINQTYGTIDYLMGKTTFDYFREKIGQGECIWSCAENGYYVGMGIGFTLANIQVGKKLIKTSKCAFNQSIKLFDASKASVDAASLIYFKFKTILNAVASKLSSNKELKLTQEDQNEILDLFKQLSGLGKISPVKVFQNNNQVNVRFEVEPAFDEFLDRVKALGLEPTSILKDENEKPLLFTLFSKKNYRLEFVSKSI